ncbi:hypothetical protein LX32DRAFT_641006 [Colletotrichum zoysiae]|uniref:Uncharacterized protein n=1 Tax=Colletotrichum zoysiae TaxID=1216348 RepID=A0AAD9HE12_9PEZI|nr:hypothetical protein LX32DRAFT_641006 [Colletotrichum zoysiae]
MYTTENGEILQRYLIHLSRMLDIKYPGQPISFAAAAMQQLFDKQADQVDYSTLYTIQRIVADCYTHIRGECDLNSILASNRVISSMANHDERVMYYRILHKNFQYHRLANIVIDTASSLRLPRNEYSALYEKGIFLLAAANPASREDWGLDGLRLLGTYHESMARALSLEDKDSEIFHLQESLSLDEVASRKAQDWGSRRLSTQLALSTRIKLISKLTSLGRVREAAELRAGMTESAFLRETHNEDLGETQSHGLS